jgi:cell wall-associated NlpC family hydrolase
LLYRHCGWILSASLPQLLKGCLLLSALIALTACHLTDVTRGPAAVRSAAVGKPTPPPKASAPAPVENIRLSEALAAAQPVPTAAAPEAPAEAPPSIVQAMVAESIEFVEPGSLLTPDDILPPGLIDRAVYTVGLSGELFTGRAGQDFLQDHGLTSDFVLTGAAMPPPPQWEPAMAAPSAGTPEAAVMVNAVNIPAPKRVAGSSRTESLLMAAYGQAGRRYTSGGQDPQSGFDASGFTRWVYAQGGFNLPRNIQTQIGGGRQVERGDLRPGDLLAYRLPGGEAGGYHVGVYTGHGNFLHACAGTGVVTETAAFGPQYAPYFLGGRRYYDDPEAGPLSDVQKMSATSSAVKLALSELGPDDTLQRNTAKKKAPAKKRKPRRKGS